MEWLLQRLQQENPSLDYRDLVEYPGDFEKLKKLEIIKFDHWIDAIECDLCDEDHHIPITKNSYGEMIIFCGSSYRIVNSEERKIWIVDREAITQNIKSKKPIIDEDQFNKTLFALYGRFAGDDDSYVIKRDGLYYFEEGIVYIKDPGAQYAVIFDVVLSLQPKGGRVKYGDIIKVCKERGLKDIKKSSIQRALTGRGANLFKYADGLRRTLVHGIPLFATATSEELEFNNKK